MMIRRLFNRRTAVSCRAYHSYPDASEKPVITNAHAAKSPKTIDKALPEFKLQEKYRLDRQFPDTPPFKPIVSSNIPPTVSEKLPNGLTVATQEMAGLMSSIAFIVGAGSSNEAKGSTGSTHFLELNAFRTTKHRAHMELIAEVEKMGAMVQCISTRDNILYCIDFLRPNLEKALDIIADTVMNPLFPDEEMEDSRMMVGLQRDELPSEIISRDLVMRAAYVGQPLGNHHYCPVDDVEQVTELSLQQFRQKYFVGSNCVLSAAGVDHALFVKLAAEKFSALPKGVAAPKLHSTFTGGLQAETRVLKEPFVKLAMAFEVGGWHSDMLVPACVLQQLLGGGRSFSAGGPGKGMYTRLYTQVLNRHHWVEAVEAFVNINDRAGLLGIDGACPPESIPSLIRVIVEQFSQLAHHPVSPEELNRAKNMLKSSMMMQLESRLVVCEDIGRQVITYGARESSGDICAKIDRVTANDLMAVASGMMSHPPAVACVGEDISTLPSFQDISHFSKAYCTDVGKKAAKKDKY